jgi:hypothetical protein
VDIDNVPENADLAMLEQFLCHRPRSNAGDSLSG